MLSGRGTRRRCSAITGRSMIVANRTASTTSTITSWIFISTKAATSTRNSESGVNPRTSPFAFHRRGLVPAGALLWAVSHGR